MNLEKKLKAYFALLPVQVELVLTDGHRPDGLDQRVAGIPSVDNQARLSERSLRHRLPAVGTTREEASALTFTDDTDKLAELRLKSKQRAEPKSGAEFKSLSH